MRLESSRRNFFGGFGLWFPPFEKIRLITKDEIDRLSRFSSRCFYNRWFYERQSLVLRIDPSRFSGDQRGLSKVGESTRFSIKEKFSSATCRRRVSSGGVNFTFVEHSHVNTKLMGICLNDQREKRGVSRGCIDRTLRTYSLSVTCRVISHRIPFDFTSIPSSILIILIRCKFSRKNRNVAVGRITYRVKRHGIVRFRKQVLASKQQPWVSRFRVNALFNRARQVLDRTTLRCKPSA